MEILAEQAATTDGRGTPITATETMAKPMLSTRKKITSSSSSSYTKGSKELPISTDDIKEPPGSTKDIKEPPMSKEDPVTHQQMTNEPLYNMMMFKKVARQMASKVCEECI